MGMKKYEQWLTSENLELLRGWCMDGLTDSDIAHNIGINLSTLSVWKNKYPQIKEALKRGKAVADYCIENALYKAALGYYVEEYEEKLDNLGNTIRCNKRRWITPSTTAQIFWLKNRRPDKWRSKQPETTYNDTSGIDSFLGAISAVDCDIPALFSDCESETSEPRAQPKTESVEQITQEQEKQGQIESIRPYY